METGDFDEARADFKQVNEIPLILIPTFQVNNYGHWHHNKPTGYFCLEWSRQLDWWFLLHICTKCATIKRYHFWFVIIFYLLVYADDGYWSIICSWCQWSTTKAEKKRAGGPFYINLGGVSNFGILWFLPLLLTSFILKAFKLPLHGLCNSF